MATITTNHALDGEECDCATCRAVALLERMEHAIDVLASESPNCPVCHVIIGAVETRRRRLESELEIIAAAPDPKQAAEDKSAVVEAMVTMTIMDLETFYAVRGAAHMMLLRGRHPMFPSRRPRQAKQVPPLERN